ncbi:hypothetical protein GUITHDRAFT_86202 [Guillardia theta CCMP2712]|uniref:Ubiquitin-like modifier-activating enzyme ATG7 n=1 Tax=Guillardia theta (strain CCMP2712) TaxID=905079 RepID=L1JGY3_GUITC|nr:hypothetical protein GUITHDRAFT_86202 [Guillardia theta CCMP2712]EKX47763.1 hypothetical protein GUITHDRAFT_86202 [Guillardia theta CCMP2712]|eukprot:XP_005834743.1 hypothetical protein GUITHDRAFT_86202 [Guillardia theta CCMP2712]
MALRHPAPASSLDASFLSRIASLKLHDLRLSLRPLPFTASFCLPHRVPQGSSSSPSQPSQERLVVAADALDLDASAIKRAVLTTGEVTIFNTIESFKELDKKQFLHNIATEMCRQIDSGEVEENPSLLVRCDVIVFSDLKDYKHYYWFAFPALCFPDPPTLSDSILSMEDVMSSDMIHQLHIGYNGLLESSGNGIPPFFIVVEDKDANTVSVKPLSHYPACAQSGKQVLFGFVDHSPLQSNPGWPLRNLLYFLNRRWSLSDVTVLCYRDFSENMQRESQAEWHSRQGRRADSDRVKETLSWELNQKGKLGPRCADLAPFMDPKRRAIESADLNLKLMRWRFLPNLDTESLSHKRCLLLGAGTLGCNVARSLTSWGFRKITFVDYGKVSYSNPTRQWLFEFEDCLSLSRSDVSLQAAADRLSRIVPNMEAEGFELSIPMPGHPVAEELQGKVLADVAKLADLIQHADLIFLLTDTRESRWLPTLLCACKSKPCINVALGFDTFVVMRHGVPDPANATDPQQIPSCNLGCYFCNDVVAPMNSTRNRTLDQQCTATRPGLSPIASSIAVEIAVSLLHHPKGCLAQADTEEEQEGTDLGILPHQIRGFLSSFSNVVVQGRPFKHCTACSAVILNQYATRGNEFLLRAFNEPNFLEEASGLTDMLREGEALMEDWEDDEVEELEP